MYTSGTDIQFDLQNYCEKLGLHVNTLLNSKRLVHLKMKYQLIYELSHTYTREQIAKFLGKNPREITYALSHRESVNSVELPNLDTEGKLRSQLTDLANIIMLKDYKINELEKIVNTHNTYKPKIKCEISKTSSKISSIIYIDDTKTELVIEETDLTKLKHAVATKINNSFKEIGFSYFVEEIHFYFNFNTFLQ